MRTSKERRHLTEKVKQKRIRKWSQPNLGIGQEKHKGMMRKLILVADAVYVSLGNTDSRIR